MTPARFTVRDGQIHDYSRPLHFDDAQNLLGVYSRLAIRCEAAGNLDQARHYRDAALDLCRAVLAVEGMMGVAA